MELSGRCGWLQSENRQLLALGQELERRILKLEASKQEPIDQPVPEMTISYRSENEADSSAERPAVRPWWAF